MDVVEEKTRATAAHSPVAEWLKANAIHITLIAASITAAWVVMRKDLEYTEARVRGVEDRMNKADSRYDELARDITKSICETNKLLQELDKKMYYMMRRYDESGGAQAHPSVARPRQAQGE